MKRAMAAAGLVAELVAELLLQLTADLWVWRLAGLCIDVAPCMCSGMWPWLLVHGCRRCSRARKAHLKHLLHEHQLVDIDATRCALLLLTRHLDRYGVWCAAVYVGFLRQHCSRRSRWHAAWGLATFLQRSVETIGFKA